MDLLSSWESWYRMTILKHIFEQESAYSHILLHKGLQQLGLGQVKVESWTWNLSLFHEWQKQAEVSHHCCFCIRRKLVIGAGAGTLTLRCRFPNRYLSHKVLCLSEVWKFFYHSSQKKKMFHSILGVTATVVPRSILRFNFWARACYFPSWNADLYTACWLQNQRIPTGNLEKHQPGAESGR